VIARRDNDLEVWTGFAGLIKKRVELPDGSGGRIREIEHITTDEQHIHVFPLQPMHQPIQELLVFVRAVVLVEELPQMPIGCVKNVHKLRQT